MIALLNMLTQLAALATAAFLALGRGQWGRAALLVVLVGGGHAAVSWVLRRHLTRRVQEDDPAGIWRLEELARAGGIAVPYPPELIALSKRYSLGYIAAIVTAVAVLVSA